MSWSPVTITVAVVGVAALIGLVVALVCAVVARGRCRDELTTMRRERDRCQRAMTRNVVATTPPSEVPLPDAWHALPCKERTLAAYSQWRRAQDGGDPANNAGAQFERVVRDCGAGPLRWYTPIELEQAVREDRAHDARLLSGT